MFPPIVVGRSHSSAFLCLRRGVSPPGACISSVSLFSLPTQRCFEERSTKLFRSSLFSAYAEVFLDHEAEAREAYAFLCLRRGVSPSLRIHSRKPGTFLCLRRGVSSIPKEVTGLTLLFSAYAEVFPPSFSAIFIAASFLCLRRGVSRARSGGRERNILFSAYAEVFPRLSKEEIKMKAFLCLRRGVSTYFFLLQCYKSFSLPTQRCFWRFSWSWW